MATKRRVQPRRIVRLELAGDFEGWWAEVDADLPLGVAQDLASGNIDRIVNALSRMVTAWNFVDKDGADLPVGVEGARGLGSALLAALMTAFQGAAQLPNS